MTRHSLTARVERLERHAHTQEDGVLHVWRLPEESDVEALDRCAVDPEDFPQVRVHVWIGARTATRLVLPPSPCWIPRRLPVIADLETALNNGMKRQAELRTNGHSLPA
jgi:hypothetical protein